MANRNAVWDPVFNIVYCTILLGKTYKKYRLRKQFLMKKYRGFLRKNLLLITAWINANKLRMKSGILHMHNPQRCLKQEDFHGHNSLLYVHEKQLEFLNVGQKILS